MGVSHCGAFYVAIAHVIFESVSFLNGAYVKFYDVDISVFKTTAYHLPFHVFVCAVHSLSCLC